MRGTLKDENLMITLISRTRVVVKMLIYRCNVHDCVQSYNFISFNYLQGIIMK